MKKTVNEDNLSKEPVPIKNLPGVGNTALTTIYCRAMDYLSPDSILKDEVAYDLYNRIECDWRPVKKGLYAHDAKLIAIRARKFDRVCRDFLSKHPDGIIVSLGSGLDYRFHRIDNGKCMLVDIDLPEIVALRKQVCPQSSRNPNLGQSVMDTSWIEKVGKLRQGKKPLQKVFFIAEGLIPYLDKTEIKELFQKITGTFGGSEIFFDVAGAKGVKLMSHHSGIKEWKATIKSGFNNGLEIENLGSGFRLLEEWYYPDDPDACRGFVMKLFWLVPLFKSILFFIHGKFEK